MLLLYDSGSNYTLLQTTINAECTMIPSHLATDRRELFMRTRALDYDEAGNSTEVIADAVVFFFIFHYKLFIWYTTFYSCFCLVPRLYAIWTHFMSRSKCLSLMGNEQKIKYSLITKYFFNYNLTIHLFNYSTSFM